MDLMRSFTIRDLEYAVEDAGKTVHETEKRICDLQSQPSIAMDEETRKRREMKIARFVARLKMDKEMLGAAKICLQRAKQDFQRFGERNTL